MTGKWSHKMRIALLAACAMSASSGALAQAAAEADALSDDIVVNAERTRTGTKTDAALTEIPQSVSIITSEEFQDRAAVDFQDIFRYSAGIQTERNGLDTRGDFFSARGFDTVQYVDGVNRMPAFVYGARMENYMLERAEVVRGPSSTLYGAGGVGGLFNGVTKRPKDEFSGEIAAVYGTQGRKELRLDVTGPIAEGISARLVALGRDGHLLHDSQADDRIMVMPVVSFKPTDNTDITLIGLYQKDKLGTQTYVPISKTISAVNAIDRISSYTFIGEPGFNKMESTYKSGSLLISHNFGDFATINSRTRFFDMDTDYQEIYGLSSYADAATVYPTGPQRRLVNRSYYILRDRYEGLGTDNNLTLKFATGPLEHQILLGVDYTYFNQDRSEGFPSAPALNLYNPVYGVGLITPPFSNVFGTKNTNLGFYAQEQVRAWDRVTLVVGVRHDKVTSKTIRAATTVLPDNKATTFRVGLIGDVVPGISAYANYSESFLPVFGTSFVGVPFIARPGRQYEAGVKFTPMRGSLVTVSLFDIKESNYISRDPDNIQNFLQGGSVGAKGVEFEANLRLPEDLFITSTYSYTRAKWIDAGSANPAGSRVANLPEHQASVWASKGFELTADLGVKIGGGVRFNGKKIDSFANFITPSYTLADAMVEFTYGPWELSINASNIFDTTTYTNCSRNPAAQDGYCYLARNRSVLGSISRKF